MWKFMKNKSGDACRIFRDEGKALSLIEHELSPKEEDYWLAHINTCEHCMAIVADILDTDAQMKHLAISTIKNELENQQSEENYFQLSDLHIETELPEDLFGQHDELLLARGTRVTPAILDILRFRGIDKVKFRKSSLVVDVDTEEITDEIPREEPKPVGPIYMSSLEGEFEPAVVSQDFRDGFFFAGELTREARFQSQHYINFVGQVTHREAIRQETKQRAINTLENSLKSLHNGFVTDLKPVRETAADIVEQIILDDHKTLSLMDLFLFSSKIYCHSFNTLVIFTALAKAMNFEKGEIIDAGQAVLLHDIGRVLKIDEPDQLHDIHRNHPMNGYKFLMKQSGFNEGKLTIVLNHHERFDGKGFPRSIKGEKLGLLDQVCILANYYDQAVTDPVHNVKREFHSAAQLIYQSPNILVSTEVTNAFLNVFGIYPPGSYIRLRSGEEGIVREANYLRPFQPVITLLRDSKGQNLPEPIEVDMRELEHSSIERAIDLAPILEQVQKS
jgi:HD-GYP domain-containing protein (c-di-GMP phosphodiesterase class II)